MEETGNIRAEKSIKIKRKAVPAQKPRRRETPYCTVFRSSLALGKNQ